MKNAYFFIILFQPLQFNKIQSGSTKFNRIFLILVNWPIFKPHEYVCMLCEAGVPEEGLSHP